ncbi:MULTISPECIES: bifunctional UDP-N-acetylmuramoyl-tripeptide:D-alanyl-D-alanine ligase/alanine racemase [unclassified Kaistella]|uniref:bifunctional UDP-N-acetylmuramoyl-tripeptide:D-alanyl-D-alanine ligase/alanine racemase n=1 Tax=unclassified Kaistella TaxID=2762626 RepID=UPI002734D2E3|nr:MULTISPECIES: bifunctional UDP-N-acetylmuramoyl-tripeptide:D-alanyl-D-alanine ligase/alanine racemase [unclassified Kaistella]MDP2452993.1 bifunctional UDP-N-acetylmuramoyl-tripeptide:D-alanyl-D-alanine ligase/alanine racemase [Kaistella sp. SH11-4b]MDP2455902.1 bifunctional UDP-N-acetylmuramoyl-tripeptide:D-alanyl-D-alanine ligase/alanine racemase [Kaistella sp. SH40-3]MDP2458806.1 bifunctional UDP-N-acetylmuramoyl-tripeptide:D-alanyl-D-alanine ligase/alanine racemase [Kaistella sp. SH19-2b]
MNYTTKQIAEITGSQFIGDENLHIKNIAYDSRTLFSVNDTAFLAINTSKNSGEKYIESAIEKGIDIIISEHHFPQYDNITWIIVDNSLKFLQKFAKYHLQQFSLKTIGITGSNGKTIVKEWLYQSLFHDYATVKSPKSFNSQLGLPLSLLEINKKHQLGIFEVGISKPEEMKILEDIFSPQIGILTHIGSAHSSNFESVDELIDEKLILFINSKTIIFNGDNELVYTKMNQFNSSKKLISFGLKNHNDVFIKNNWTDKTQGLIIQYFEEEFSVPINQRDEATISNALCVISTLKEFGFENSKIIEKLNALKSVEMRLESVNGIRNNLIINDSFNLDLDSLKIAFQNIKEYNKPNKTLILTDFVEGKNADQLYQEVSALTNEQNFKSVFLIGEEITKFEKLFQSTTSTFNNTTELIESAHLNQIEDHLILLKGARKFEIDKVKSYLELQKHDTVLEVNLNSILHNINVHKALLKPETKMMAMVKAYSYGLGGYEIAEFLQHHHIDYLGVAYADEGVDLRKNGITTPIMVMNPEQHSYNIIIDYNLEPEIYSFRVLELFNEKLVQKGIQHRYPIHIKLETGMHRLGFKKDELSELIEKLKLMNVKLKSIFSHLSSSDDDEENEYTLEQIHIFNENSQKLIKGIKEQPIRHILNTSGIVNFTDYQFDMVRIGIGMVGISANAEIKKQLKSAVTFKTVISQISEVKAGESVGYNRRFKAIKDTRIATIPVGYADGIPRLVGNNSGFVGIRKELFPIVGNVCMDMMMIDLETSLVKEGEEVIIFNSNPSLEDFAEYCKTISYEVLTSISRRVKRIYIKD